MTEVKIVQGCKIDPLPGGQYLVVTATVPYEDFVSGCCDSKGVVKRSYWNDLKLYKTLLGAQNRVRKIKSEAWREYVSQNNLHSLN